MLFTHTFAVNYKANLVTILINQEGGSFYAKVVLTESGAIALADSLSKDEKGVVEKVDGTICTGLRVEDPSFHVLEIHKNSRKPDSDRVYCRHGSQIEHLIENLKVAADAVSSEV